MYSLRRRALSQNFFHSRKLVEKLIRQSSIGPHDTVVDIGTGKGIITEELLKRSKKVIGIEIDTSLYFYLKNKLAHSPNLQLLNGDFLTYKLPRHPYKVFSNIPFSIEGKIIRRLLTCPNPPEDCYLVMRKDLAERLSGMKKENQFSISYKPWFSFSILHQFRKTDFEPAATMDSVLLRFAKRITPLLPFDEQKKYMTFIGYGFGGGKRVKQNLQMFFTYHQLKKFGKIYGFSPRSKPSDLMLNQWIGLYKCC